ncbi:MAG: 3-isopropylmalate dehydrogenase [Candidatus Omnitrophica bacterium]|nr:3-isopropylmalate dehydrogenase [Candidatus Omnitrophota bacterium]MDE2214163.1 3-isopropylmalate dehydrogenase [Candidatus Omnitrophota bacterium]MDE2231200.1 3-isopropylmalate dehydrogenase [Candidatus Omnitrophota bacterium]
MKTYRLAIIPGDGIGPEVVAQGLKVLDAAGRKFAFTTRRENFDFGGARYLKKAQVLSDEEMNALRAFDAIYLGAVGHPDVKPGILERGVLLKLRFGLDQYINLRPVRLYQNVATPIKNKGPEHIDYVVVRENSGDVYTGEGEIRNQGTGQEVATQIMVYSHAQVERCLKYAFEYVMKRHADKPWKGLSEEDRKAGFIGKLTLCGKSNVLTNVFGLWDRVMNDMAQQYPKVKLDYAHVDAMCIFLIEAPERFDVIVTTNMFGDIITDLAAVTQGGMGVAPSGNINPNGVSMFEPVHGSAPQFTGKGVANPLAAILTVKLMLEHLKEEKAAQAIDAAVQSVMLKMKSMLIGQMGYSTDQIGDMVAGVLK